MFRELIWIGRTIQSESPNCSLKQYRLDIRFTFPESPPFKDVKYANRIFTHSKQRNAFRSGKSSATFATLRSPMELFDKLWFKKRLILNKNFQSQPDLEFICFILTSISPSLTQKSPKAVYVALPLIFSDARVAEVTYQRLQETLEYEIHPIG